ncbi:MAG: ribbon-helix-helix domain-containing protein [Candidatus Obscuribacterales bacterium]|nr:ribbon-helix-helix domain-containing protein [Candidatus Obscuribacterales bacterium]
MKTGTVTVRLPKEKIEQLQEMAKAKGATLSEFVREQILSSLDGQGSNNSGADLKKQLSDMEANLSSAQQAMAETLLLILTNAVGTRYHASLATTYADDIITVMQTGNILSEKEVERRRVVREKEAQRIEDAVIEGVLGSKAKDKRKVN